MDPLQSFNPTNYHQLGMGVVFYGVLILITFLSISLIYILVKNGRNKVLAFFVSFIYLTFFLSLAGQGIGFLNQIK